MRNSAKALTVATLTLVVCLASQASAQQFSNQSNPDGPAVFVVHNGRLHMNGSIFPRTVNRFRTAMNGNPGLKTLVLHDVPGSVDDDAALHLYRAVRSRGLNTHVPADGIVASGGVDLFCAGVFRSADPSSLLLVHPWEDDQIGRGDRVPLNHSAHDFYRSYYREMEIADGFYEHTLFAPRTNLTRGNISIPDMHNMTQADRVRFSLMNGCLARLQPGTQVTVQQLTGTWAFEFDGFPASLNISPDSSFDYAVGNVRASGLVHVNGSQVTLTDRNGEPWWLTVQQVQPDSIRFTDITWNRRPSPPPTLPVPPTLNLQGTWTEVRTDDQSGKTITVAGNNYFEVSNDGVFSGTIRLTNDLLTILGNDGTVETFRVVADQDNRLKFADGQSGQPIERFHWVRS